MSWLSQHWESVYVTGRRFLRGTPSKVGPFTIGQDGDKAMLKMPSDSKPRPDADFHHYVQWLTEATRFETSILLVILCNALTLAAETVPDLADFQTHFYILDELYLSIYTVEFLMKLYAQPRDYWRNAYNMFDFVILIISYMQKIAIAVTFSSTGLLALKSLKALRTLRVLRIVSYSSGLQVLVTALVETIRKYVIAVLLLLLMVVFLFGVMGYYLFSEHDPENWGTLGKSMVSLLTMVTADGWVEISEKLEATSGIQNVRIYVISVIFIGHFIFTNIFIGVILINISEATTNYRMQLKMKRSNSHKKQKEEEKEERRKKIMKLEGWQKQGFAQNLDCVSYFLRHDQVRTIRDPLASPVFIDDIIHTLADSMSKAEKSIHLHRLMTENLYLMMEHGKCG